MKRLTITIPITPVPKARPRFTRAGHAYTPKKTADYEKAIAAVWRQATKNFKYDREQPLYINLAFGLPIAKSTPKGKAVLDALNGVAWEDDSQVVRVGIFKEYAKEPYVYIYIHDDAE